MIIFISLLILLRILGWNILTINTVMFMYVNRNKGVPIFNQFKLNFIIRGDLSMIMIFIMIMILILSIMRLEKLCRAENERHLKEMTKINNNE